MRRPASARAPFPTRIRTRIARSGFTDLHNGIGVASAAAAVADRQGDAGARRSRDRSSPSARLSEKLCVGKPFMARDGLFDGLDAVVAWHPRPYSTVEWDLGPGMQQGEIFDFHGKSAYSARPWTGINALDAVTLMNVIMQFMREHLPRDDRATHHRNDLARRRAPDLDPRPRADLVHSPRQRRAPASSAPRPSLSRAAEAACVAIGTTFKRRIISATRPWLPNHAMAELCFRNLRARRRRRISRRKPRLSPRKC